MLDYSIDFTNQKDVPTAALCKEEDGNKKKTKRTIILIALTFCIILLFALAVVICVLLRKGWSVFYTFTKLQVIFRDGILVY